MIDCSRRTSPPSPDSTLAHSAFSLPASPPRPTRPGRLPKASQVKPEDVHAFVAARFADDLHAKRVLSLASGVLGVLHAASLAIHAIGQGLAQARGLTPKHAIKQVDRLLSNQGLVLEELLPLWATFLLAQRSEAHLTLDWTDFDKDEQATLCLNLITSHGRATPLLWKTVPTAFLKGWRNHHEDALLHQLHDLLPPGLKVTLMADRGFGDQALYRLLDDLGFAFVIRFRGVITVGLPDGTSTKAHDLVPANGRPKLYRNVTVTADRTPVAGVVTVQDRLMADPWFLATNLTDLTARQLVTLYGRRFTTEENFRDTKDPRFGLGLSATSITTCERRDRLLLLAAMAQTLLTLLGAAAEEVGLDKKLKASTTKKRTHSLFRQGMYWYGAIPTMPEEWLQPLMTVFGRLLSDHPNLSKILGVI